MLCRFPFRLLAVACLTLGLSLGCQAKPAAAPGKPAAGPKKAKASRLTDGDAPADAAPADTDTKPAPSDSSQSPPSNLESKKADEPAKITSMLQVQQTAFGKTADNQEITLYTLSNGAGLTVKLINYGATIISVETPDKDGKIANINLGFPSLDGYLQRHPYFGSTVGRYCNRIAGGKFKLGDQEYTLATNNAPNHLHGGKVGFDARVWTAESKILDDSAGVEFTLVSADGDEGYPGKLTAKVLYAINSRNELTMQYSATTDKATVVNLTNHCYWNLAGAGNGTILEHQLQVEADKYLPVDETSIPTGALADVKGTPFDFTTPHAIGERIGELKGEPGGYDHCYALRAQDGKLTLAAKVTDPSSGRVMEILTTEPGIQFYTGNYLAGGDAENKFPKNGALCLETQHYPDSPNRPEFPSTTLEPGKTYSSTTVHRFSVAK